MIRTFVGLPFFEREWLRLGLSDQDRKDLETELLEKSNWRYFMSKLFEGLKESVKDAGKFLRGEDVPELTLHTVKIKPLEEKTGRDLKKIRARFGLSQGALAEIVGVSRKTVESWEHGGVSSKPVARILQLIEAEPRIMAFLVEQKRKTESVR